MEESRTLTAKTTGSNPSPATKLILDHPDELKEGVRLMMRVWRNKENAEGKRPGRTVITNSVDEWNTWAQKLYDESIPGERIYASVEPRSVPKAIRVFKERQLDADYDSTEVRDAFYHECFTRWLSCLGAPQASASRLFLFDCDNFADSALLYDDLRVNNLLPNVVHSYDTKNGAHFITRPFNPAVLSEAYRGIMHKNALLLVGWR
jgi:hypothetical protein